MIGATTVSGTMIAADMAGIRVFVTGGIGGVHRGAESNFDVSADLYELAKTPVAVVSAGAKAILDIPKTLEMLESFGVPVIGYGTSKFPAFYSADSGCRVSHRIDSPKSIALMLKAHWNLPRSGGVLIANPLEDSSALEIDIVERAVDLGLQRALDAGISGKDLTPFLLKFIVEETGGKSLEANIALVLSNAHVGSLVSIAFANH
jgi:pseudouridine-5'-phosphate glycosidase